MSMSHHTCVHCGHWWPAHRGQTPLGPQEPQIGNWSQTQTSRLDVFQGWPENVPWEGRTEIFSCLDPLVIVTNSQENNLDVLIVIFVPRKKTFKKVWIFFLSPKRKSQPVDLKSFVEVDMIHQTGARPHSVMELVVRPPAVNANKYDSLFLSKLLYQSCLPSYNLL